MDEDELKEFFKNTFDTVADGYDHAAMRFFPESAQRISSYLNLKGDEHLLDVATGTGCVALTLAKDVPNGQVTGIDFSKGMLSQAKKKKEERGGANVNFIEMDMQSIGFPDNHFDTAVSAFSIFFVEDMEKQVSHIAEKVKVGGTILITTFFDNAFSPLVGLFLTRLATYGIEVPTLVWKQVATTEQCTLLLKEAGLHNVRSEQVDCGYYLNDAVDWWYIIWNGGFRGLVEQLTPDDLKQFQQEHLAEVETLASVQGVWLEMSILYTSGTKK